MQQRPATSVELDQLVDQIYDNPSLVYYATALVSDKLEEAGPDGARAIARALRAMRPGKGNIRDVFDAFYSVLIGIGRRYPDEIRALALDQTLGGNKMLVEWVVKQLDGEQPPDPRIVESICLIPRHFKGSDKSPAELVRESGYATLSQTPLWQAAEDYLLAHPDVIDDWARYSEDKRTSSGWYFIPKPEGGGVVGCVGPNIDQFTSNSTARACALFMHHEVHAIYVGSLSS